MKAVKIIDEDLYCGINNCILYEHNTFVKIHGNYKNGFELGKLKSVGFVSEEAYYSLYPTIETTNAKYTIIAGETSWGGEGFVAVIYKNINKYKWVLSLESMNNPIEISVTENIIKLQTDLEVSNGVTFIIPIETPEKFKIG